MSGEVQIVIAIIGVLAAVLTITLNKFTERKAREMQIKESKYINFLEAIINMRTGKNYGDQLNSTLQVIYLIGNADVAKSVQAFVELFIERTNNNQHKESVEEKADKQNRLYASMIIAMKKDLYGIKRLKQYPDKIGLVDFKDQAI